MKRIVEIFIDFQETKIDASSDQGDQPENIIGDIRFDNVTFTYPARQETPVGICWIFFKDFIGEDLDSEDIFVENSCGKNRCFSRRIRIWK